MAMVERRVLMAGGVATTAALASGATSWLTRPAHASARRPHRAVGSPDTAAAGPAGSEELGVPMRSVNVRAGTVGQLDGRPAGYVFSNGSPGVFTVIDVETGDQLAAHEITGYESSYAVQIAPDGTVYFEARPTGHLFRYLPDEDRTEDLGRATQGANAIDALVIDENGVIHGGTSPNAHLFSYDPSAGEFTDHGPVTEDETACRPAAVVDGTIYAGTSPNGRLFAVDLESASTTEIALPAEHASTANVTVPTHRDGLLFVFASTDLPCLTYDLQAGEWIDELPTYGADTGSTAPLGPHVYFEDQHNHDLWRYHLGNREGTATSFSTEGLGSITRAIGTAELDQAGFPQTSIVGVGLSGRVWNWNPETERERWIDADVRPSPVRIRRLGAGPDGNVYVSGFFTSGVMARYLVAQDELEQLEGPTQIEGFGIHDGLLYFGVYPGADLMRYDPDQPWNFGTNPETLFSLADEGQDRPWAITGIGDRVAIGTLAASGSLDGALTFYTPATDEVDYVGTLFEAHGVVSLTANEPILAGGTSTRVSGSRPIEDEARLFLWDAENDELAWDGVVFDDAHTIGDVVFADDGRLWGLTNNARVFEFDVESREVVRSTLVRPDSNASGGFPELFFARDGAIYGSTGTRHNGALFRLDPDSLDVEILESAETANATLGPDGHVYYAREDSTLVRLRVDEPAA